MKKFKFKLEVVLTERKRIEDLRLREWTMAKRYLQALLDDLNVLEQELMSAFERMTELGTDSSMTHVGMFAAVEDFISGQKTRIVWKTQDIQKATKLSERARGEYLKARQKREALEKLKERRLSEHKDNVRKHELKQLDDIYIMNGAAQRRMSEDDVPEAKT